MALIYRSTGAWGAGKGSNLTAAEVDGNFYDIDQRVEDLETNPPIPAHIAEIDVNGRLLTIHLSNGNAFGPYSLPVAATTFKGEWEAGFVYQALDLFTIEDDGIYLVLDDYEAPTEFDPEATNSDGALLQRVFGWPPNNKMSLATRQVGDFDLSPALMGDYVRILDDSSVSVNILADVGDEDEDIPVSSVVTLRQVGEGPVRLTWDDGVLVHIPKDQLSSFRGRGATVTVIKVGPDEYDVTGDLTVLAEVPTE